MTSGQGLAVLDGLVTQQAATIAYCNNFLIMAYCSLAAFPLIVMFQTPKAVPAPVRVGDVRRTAAVAD